MKRLMRQSLASYGRGNSKSKTAITQAEKKFLCKAVTQDMIINALAHRSLAPCALRNPFSLVSIEKWEPVSNKQEDVCWHTILFHYQRRFFSFEPCRINFQGKGDHRCPSHCSASGSEACRNLEDLAVSNLGDWEGELKEGERRELQVAQG